MSTRPLNLLSIFEPNTFVAYVRQRSRADNSRRQWQFQEAPKAFLCSGLFWAAKHTEVIASLMYGHQTECRLRCWLSTSAYGRMQETPNCLCAMYTMHSYLIFIMFKCTDGSYCIPRSYTFERSPSKVKCCVCVCFASLACGLNDWFSGPHAYRTPRLRM